MRMAADILKPIYMIVFTLFFSDCEKQQLIDITLSEVTPCHDH